MTSGYNSEAKDERWSIKSEYRRSIATSGWNMKSSSAFSLQPSAFSLLLTSDLFYKPSSATPKNRASWTPSFSNWAKDIGCPTRVSGTFLLPLARKYSDRRGFKPSLISKRTACTSWIGNLSSIRRFLPGNPQRKIRTWPVSLLNSF